MSPQTQLKIAGRARIVDFKAGGSREAIADILYWNNLNNLSVVSFDRFLPVCSTMAAIVPMKKSVHDNIIPRSIPFREQRKMFDYARKPFISYEPWAQITSALRVYGNKMETISPSVKSTQVAINRYDIAVQLSSCELHMCHVSCVTCNVRCSQLCIRCQENCIVELMSE